MSRMGSSGSVEKACTCTLICRSTSDGDGSDDDDDDTDAVAVVGKTKVPSPSPSPPPLLLPLLRPNASGYVSASPMNTSRKSVADAGRFMMTSVKGTGVGREHRWRMKSLGRER